MAAVVVLALRIAGVTAATLAVGGAFTAIVLGLAAQQTLGSLFDGIVLAGSLEGTVSSLGLFYATLVQGADRLQVPNSVLISLVVVPLREPPKVDFKARFSLEASPRLIEEQLLAAIRVPTRYPPNVSLEEVDEEGVVLRVSATPLRPDDGSQLAEEVLAALKPAPARSD